MHYLSIPKVFYSMGDSIQVFNTIDLADYLRAVENGRLVYVHEPKGLYMARSAAGGDPVSRSQHYQQGLSLAAINREISRGYEFGNLYPSSPENVVKNATERGPVISYKDLATPCLRLGYTLDIDTGVLLPVTSIRNDKGTVLRPAWSPQLEEAYVILGCDLDDSEHNFLEPIDFFLETRGLQEFLPSAIRYVEYVQGMAAARHAQV